MARKKTNKQARMLVENYFMPAGKKRIEGGSESGQSAVYRDLYGEASIDANGNTIAVGRG